MEKWLPLQYNDGNFGEFYEVSSHGRLRNANTKKIRKLSSHNRGYVSCYVHIGSSYKTKHILLHRAVACTFIPNQNNLPQVNHIDGDKTNNHMSNLEWVTVEENREHAINTGLMGVSVRGIHKITGDIVEFKTVSEAAKFLGRKYPSDIGKVVNQKKHRKTCCGYYWERINEQVL